MATISVTFRKEVKIDLNEYFSKLPPKVRRAVEDALFELLGGQLPKKNSTRLSSKNVKDSMFLKRTDRIPTRRDSKMAVAIAMIDREYPSGEVLKDDCIKVCKTVGLPLSSGVHNMVRSNYLQVQE